MNYINDNQVELELTDKQYNEIIKLLGLALSPKQVYAIHKEYSNGEWANMPMCIHEVSLYHKTAIETLGKYSYQEIEDIWNKRK